MEFYPGIGQAVAERTILRKKQDGSWETWQDVAHRVSLGNSLLCKNPTEQKEEYAALYKHMSKGNIVLSGRHLQHGDETQPERNIELFSNCSTACSSFMLFLLLMNGSGVGRCYDDDMMLVDWDNAPNIRCVLDDSHPDFDYSAHESVRDAKHKYGSGKDILWHSVEDSREGWAKALEIWENAAFEKIHKDKLFILDFSKVRAKGTFIGGMQNRPASGPVPLMNAFYKASTLKGGTLPKWQQAMYIDHYFAECVLVGGCRRSARMSTKYWKDQSVLEFIKIKRPIEYYGKKPAEVYEYRKGLSSSPNSFLWSSNNSVMVDSEFWTLVNLTRKDKRFKTKLANHARQVFKAITTCSYYDGTGEPGIINADRLTSNTDGMDKITGSFNSKKYTINEDTLVYTSRLIKRAKAKSYLLITNPCSEICLSIYGGYCIIGDVIPYHASSLDEAEEAFRATTRCLIRINLMNSIYNEETKRTNRIGVSITGVHEFAWKFFKFSFPDLINEEKSKPFWDAIGRFKRAVQDEAAKYSRKLGLDVPHTDTTIKPAGSTSKLFSLSEGWHLPAMKFYLRWVQFRTSDPLVEEYRKLGYPFKELNTYKNTVIIGFPTDTVCSKIIPEDKLVTASEASLEDQYLWISLGEKYWITGVDEKGNPLKRDSGNQISYTAKYSQDQISYNEFSNILKRYQSKIKCCSVMPKEDKSSYEYLPEQSVTKAEYEGLLSDIKRAAKEDVDKVHIDCAGGACPVDFRKPELVSV